MDDKKKKRLLREEIEAVYTFTWRVSNSLRYLEKGKIVSALWVLVYYLCFKKEKKSIRNSITRNSILYPYMHLSLRQKMSE